MILSCPASVVQAHGALVLNAQSFIVGSPEGLAESVCNDDCGVGSPLSSVSRM